MAITDKEEGVWILNQVYNKQMEGDIWSYTGADAMFVWGENDKGQLGQNDVVNQSSPTQIPGTTWSADPHQNLGIDFTGAFKSDGTYWTWGLNTDGQLGHNNKTQYSSPVQLPGTTWSNVSMGGDNGKSCIAVKTDGTLFCWGGNLHGQLGLNNKTDYSSPRQVGESNPDTWKIGSAGADYMLGVKTDGTLWSWGSNETGEMGINSSGDDRSSPVQIGSDTTWAPGYNKIAMSIPGAFAIKTDGTLWSWGNNTGGASGYLGLGDSASRSSPAQIPGSWNIVACTDSSTWAIKTDGSLWSWGNGYNGRQGHNNDTQYNSPVQVGSLTNYAEIGTSADSGHFLTQA